MYNVNLRKMQCECFRGCLRGPCKHKAFLVRKYNLESLEILPTPEMIKLRKVFYFIGTGKVINDDWFRTLSGKNKPEDFEIELGTENNNDLEEEEIPDVPDINFDEDSEDEEEVLEELETCLHEFCSRIRCDYKKDKDGYKKAIAKFVTTTKKLTTAKDLTVQHAMHTFGKEAYKPAVAGVKHNSGVIPIQPTSLSRRAFKHRGSGPSQSGRPTKDVTKKRKQMNVLEDDENIRFSLPPEKRKKSYPHSLSNSTSSGRRDERKH